MPIPESLSNRDLRSLFCERFNCPPSDYDRRAFRKCLYLHARIIAPLQLLLNPGCFERDLIFIDYIGKARDLKEVAAEVAALHYQDLTEPRFTRKALRLRVSARKASKLAKRLFQS